MVNRRSRRRHSLSCDPPAPPRLAFLVAGLAACTSSAARPPRWVAGRSGRSGGSSGGQRRRSGSGGRDVSERRPGQRRPARRLGRRDRQRRPHPRRRRRRRDGRRAGRHPGAPPARAAAAPPAAPEHRLGQLRQRAGRPGPRHRDRRRRDLCLQRGRQQRRRLGLTPLAISPIPGGGSRLAFLGKSDSTVHS